jgi:hypothetical protein
MKLGKKTKYAVLNLIAPGIGQIAMKKYFRGAFQILFTVGCFIWMLHSFVLIVVGNLHNARDGKPINYDLSGIFIPMGLIFVLWVFSYFDLFFLCSPPESADTIKTEHHKEETKPVRSVSDKQEAAIRAEVARQLEEMKKNSGTDKDYDDNSADS